MPRNTTFAQIPNKKNKITVSEDVIEQIKALVKKAGYLPGARLPSERDLAQQLGVSRPSVRHALSALTQAGVLKTRQGAGTVVSGSSENLLRAPFEFLMLMENPSVYDLYEVRELIEVHLAGRAAERRTELDLAAIAETLQEMRGPETGGEYTTAPDMAFHAALSAAAHMPILERILVCLQDGIRTCMVSALPAVWDWKASFSIHENIYDAIRQQSATDARRAMLIHMAVAIEELRRLDRTEAEREIRGH